MNKVSCSVLDQGFFSIPKNQNQLRLDIDKDTIGGHGKKVMTVACFSNEYTRYLFLCKIKQAENDLSQA